MSLRAARAIGAARHVAYFRKEGRAGQARRIVEGMLNPEAIEYPMEYPVTTELPFDSPEYTDALARFYDDWANRLAALAATEDVVVLCEGDPFFYGSFMHLHSRLQGRVPVEVIPGITGMTGCWHATDTPITWGDDVLTVLMGTLPEDDLVRHMSQRRRAGGDEDRAQPAPRPPRAGAGGAAGRRPGWWNAARCRTSASPAWPRSMPPTAPISRSSWSTATAAARRCAE